MEGSVCGKERERRGGREEERRERGKLLKGMGSSRDGGERKDGWREGKCGRKAMDGREKKGVKGREDRNGRIGWRR